MIIITDPDIRCNADKFSAESHAVTAILEKQGYPHGTLKMFLVLTHGGRSRAQEIADAYTVPETGDDAQNNSLAL